MFIRTWPEKLNLNFPRCISPDIDVLFLCVGHGEARKFLIENQVNPEIRIIDLSQDFRLESNNRLAHDRKALCLWFA